jgi:hypothetical protein
MAGFRKFCKTVGRLCGAIATSIAPFHPVIAAALAVVGIATEVTTQDRDRRQSNTQIY